MSEALQNLDQAITHWREHRSSPEVSAKSANPYGAKIHALNIEWGETKAEHQATLQAKRQRYLEQRDRLLEMSAKWKEENPQVKNPTGRPATPHPPEVKIAAAKALRDGYTKSTLRGLLGISSTQKLDALLVEGEELLQAEESK